MWNILDSEMHRRRAEVLYEVEMRLRKAGWSSGFVYNEGRYAAALAALETNRDIMIE